MIYLFWQLDSIRGVLSFIAFIIFIFTVITTLFKLATLESSGHCDFWHILKHLKNCTIIIVLIVFVFSLIPSRQNALGMYATHLLLNTNIAEDAEDKIIEIYNRIMEDINKNINTPGEKE